MSINDWLLIWSNLCYDLIVDSAELRRLEEEEDDDDVDYDEEIDDDDNDDDERELVGQLGSARLRATIFASRFAANALRGHKLRSSNSRGLKMLQKPPEPDFNEE
ncbi:CYCLIC NUCLEOTIDE-GATED ION CHANNEL 7-RELATED [Salix viminalis]|uniref:CYCLIC NUCLEOTIDE-GATED ION CHANNEL 7-RELATED n=1 Tax=Salix viminalis TaxID=40686 RepID=A0A9Q0YXS2_SALVM|nr:CYCLIC NUCLEOTIDE-GATED ION CHANNEL 7-RELATED [Salix viminalis]